MSLKKKAELQVNNCYFYFMLKTLFFLSVFNTLGCLSQNVIYQDVFHGGVTGGGYNPTWNSNSNGIIDIYIEPGSTIKKAFLFIGCYNHPETKMIQLNGINIVIDTSNSIGNDFNYNPLNIDFSLKTILIDISEIISPFETQIAITPPLIQQNELIGRYVEYYVYIAYENPLLNIINPVILLNQQNCQEIMSYSINNLNQMNLANNVGLAINSASICDTINDGAIVNIDSQTIGIIGGNDENNSMTCAGVSGTFYYQNLSLFGLSDDSANGTMDGTDAIANIESYTIQNDNINIEFQYQNPNQLGYPNAEKSNIIWQLYLTYSTTCDTFSVTTIPDTTICPNSPLQLYATGGTSTGSAPAYEWLPATNLSCSDCPNPIFTGDSSQFYTVRIWNNDSCSVVRPVKVIVRKEPQFGSITYTPTICGTNSGQVILSSQVGIATPISYSWNGGTNQPSGTFSNLYTGNQLFTLQDGFDCTNDTLITVLDNNPTIAQFSSDPTNGTVSLTVSVSNASQFATDYSWWLNGVDQGNTFSSFTCDTSGTYTIELIAWQYDPSCADTFSLSVIALDRLIIPTAFTPDNDGVNDTWELPNIDAIYPKNVVHIFDRWGVLLYETKEGKYASNSWDGTFEGKALPVGSYYFIIDLNDGVMEVLKGVTSIIK